MEETLTMIEQCQMDMSSGQPCLICPLKQAEACAPVITTLSRLAGRMNRVDHRLSAADRALIVQEALSEMILVVAKQDDGQEGIGSIAAFTGKIFSNKRADFYKKLPRFGELSTFEVEELPAGLASLVSAHADILTLQGQQYPARLCSPPRCIAHCLPYPHKKRGETGYRPCAAIAGEAN